MLSRACLVAAVFSLGGWSADPVRISVQAVDWQGARHPNMPIEVTDAAGKVVRFETDEAGEGTVNLPAGVYEFTTGPHQFWRPVRRARVILVAGKSLTLPVVTHDFVSGHDEPPPKPLLYDDWDLDGQYVNVAYRNKNTYGRDVTYWGAVLTIDRATVSASTLRVLPDRRTVEARNNVVILRENTVTEAPEVSLDLLSLAGRGARR